MSAELFAAEEALLARAKASAGAPDASLTTELTDAYGKLLKQTKRLIRMSDRSEARIRTAAKEIEDKNQALAEAQAELARYSEGLEQTVAERAQQLEHSQLKLQRLVECGIALSGETSGDNLLSQILRAAKELAHSDGGTLYIRDDDQLLFEVIETDSLGLKKGGDTGEEIGLPPVRLFDPESREPNYANVASCSALVGETIVIEDAYTDDRFDFRGTRMFDEQTGYRSKSFLTVPLKPRGKDVIGVLQLLNAIDDETGEVIPFADDVIGFVEALAAQAAVALDNQALIEAQKALLDSFIELIAGAIDAKSPYTGGHCNRVPELAMMLAEAAEAKTEGPFADFRFESEDEWREFRIGAWLHDCGKVTTPEYVVDKATKLETIYNRIHEIRGRFEILLRDAEIRHLKAKLAGEAPPDDDLEAEKQALADDFAFLAKANIGGEFMRDEDQARCKTIGARTWVRHFDDRLGLSAMEMERVEDIPPKPLPVTEKLLDDKPEHIIQRDNPDPFGENPHGFNMDVPEHLYNYGELYNLCIQRGTLTAEERFKINDHIVQTINMLHQLPYPKHLARVPEIAGNHHETMIGTGYPRKLTKDEMSVPSRIMAIADIFEALTASDRPYKPPKTLSEAIKIMGFMKKDQHIDPDLFELFLESNIHREYAERFLLEDQID